MVPLESSFPIYAGIDWAEQSHEVCVLRDSRPLHRSFANTPEGIAALAAWLSTFAPLPGEVAIAIEVPHGPVVEGLLLRGFALFAINPKQLDRHRDRYSLAGAKDDRRDAFVLADSLRLDRHSFRPVVLPPAAVVELRAVTRLRSRLIRTRTRLANQLRSQLLACAPHYLSLSGAADEPWFWDLLALLKSPGGVSCPARATVAALLKRRRISRLSADDVLAVLRTPPLLLAPGTLPAAAFVIASILPNLKLLATEISRAERRIDALLSSLAAEVDAQPSDVAIIDSYPGAGRIIVAGLIAEAYQPLLERDLERLRSQSGCAPVTRRSGKGLIVLRRRSVNPHLRDILFFLADAAMKNDPWARAFYSASRARGHSHPRALRGLGNRILDQLLAMLTHRQCFDPDRRRSPVSTGQAA